LLEFVALGKTTLPEELALDILSKADFAVGVFDFLFDELRTLSLCRMQVGLTATMLPSGKRSSTSACTLRLGCCMVEIGIVVGHFNNYNKSFEG